MRMKSTLLFLVVLLLLSITSFALAEHPMPQYQKPPTATGIVPDSWMITKSQPTTPMPARAATAEEAATYMPGKLMKVRVLVVIYTNTAGGTINAAQINKLKSEMEEARIFYFRNSYCRLLMDISYIIIPDYRGIEEFWELYPNAYWMTFWDVAGNGNSVQKDLRDRGVTNNMYSAVINFYAWGENGYNAALGGGTYGVDVNFLGKTAYVGIPHCWDPDTNDWFVIHEFHHALDSMFHYSGYPEYPHADLPIELPGDFGENYDFNAFIMRTWPLHKWMALKTPWGNQISIADADLDGLPDSGDLPITEALLGSSTSAVDTDGDGLDDLGEAMAGIFRASLTNKVDTDNDGIIDGFDKYPLYAINEYIPKASPTIDGNLDSVWHLVGSPITQSSTRFNSTIRANWDANYFYLAFVTSGFNSHFVRPHLYIDADNDGWFHGKDNYEIVLNPETESVERVHIWDCSPEAVAAYGGAIWDDDSRYEDGRLVVSKDLKFRTTRAGNTYVMELSIPKNVATKLIPRHGAPIGVRINYNDIGYNYKQWALAFERDVFVDLVLVDAPAVVREGSISGTKDRTDGQTIDIIGKAVSAVFSGAFYIEEDDRSSGIKIDSSEKVAVGDRVRVVGKLATVAGERVIQNAVVNKLPVSLTPP